MTTRDDGGPAFPHGVYDENKMSPSGERGCWQYGYGLSLRDYFAAKAFPAIYAVAMKEAGEGSGLFQHENWPVGLALDSYRMADAMLKARAK